MIIKGLVVFEWELLISRLSETGFKNLKLRSNPRSRFDHRYANSLKKVPNFIAALKLFWGQQSMLSAWITLKYLLE